MKGQGQGQGQVRELQSAWRFFLGHAGYATPPGRVKCAWDLARAEREATKRGWYVSWRVDDDCFCRQIRGQYGFSDQEMLTCPCERDSSCQCEGAVLMNREPEYCDERDAEWIASLWGICGADQAYRRVVAAELALEALGPEWDEVARWNALLARVTADLNMAGSPMG